MPCFWLSHMVSQIYANYISNNSKIVQRNFFTAIIAKFLINALPQHAVIFNFPAQSFTNFQEIIFVILRVCRVFFLFLSTLEFFEIIWTYEKFLVILQITCMAKLESEENKFTCKFALKQYLSILCGEVIICIIKW